MFLYSVSFGEKQIRGPSPVHLAGVGCEGFSVKQLQRERVVTVWSRGLPTTSCRQVCPKALPGADGTEIGAMRAVGTCPRGWECLSLKS